MVVAGLSNRFDSWGRMEIDMACIAGRQPLVWLAVGLWMGCAGKNAAAPAAVSAVPAGSVSLVIDNEVPPPEPTVPASPIATPTVAVPGAPELPPLSGALTDIDFVTLKSTVQTFTVDSDRPMFPVTDLRVAARMKAALEFDPSWRVGTWEGQTVAWKRGADEKGWATPWGGYLSTRGVTARTLYRFDKRPEEHPWSASGLVARNAAATQSMKVRGWKVDAGQWTDQMAAAFTIDGMGVSFEMHEISAQLSLVATQAALQQATMLAGTIAGQLAGGNLQRSSLAMLSADGAEIGDPMVSVERSARFGGLDIRGRANGGGPGWLWVRLIDLDGEVWSEAVVAQCTAERTGYDTNRQLQAYFQSVVPTSGVVPGGGTAEVWFQSDDGAAPRMLVRAPFVLDPPVDGPRLPVD